MHSTCHSLCRFLSSSPSLLSLECTTAFSDTTSSFSSLISFRASSKDFETSSNLFNITSGSGGKHRLTLQDAHVLSNLIHTSLEIIFCQVIKCHLANAIEETHHRYNGVFFESAVPRHPQI